MSEYTGITIPDVQKLDYIDYLAYRRDAFIWKMSQTKEGTEYLNNAYRLEQTSPDKGQLRKRFGRK